MDYPAPSPPYLGPPFRNSGNGNKPIDRIVIHETQSATKAGGARAIAAFFRSPAARGSTQYVVDPDEVIQSGYDDLICWGAPPNSHSLHIEMCRVSSWDLSSWFGGKLPRGVREAEDEDKREDLDPGPARQFANVFRTLTPSYRRLLNRTARLTAELCLAYDVPPYWRTAAQLKAGQRGVTTHRQVSLAWGQSSHWDPGAWPRRAFMRRVRRYHRTLPAELAARQARARRRNV